MSNSQGFSATLAQLPSLAELFRFFLAGRHLNRIAEPALWAELEENKTQYIELFTALGYDLQFDSRGFAWFYTEQSNRTIGRISQQLALLFMVIFDVQANAGAFLQGFDKWLIDRAFLDEAYQQHKELLDTEELTADKLADLLGRAQNLGFTLATPNGWRLLPALYRYLDHFEDLAQVMARDKEE